MLGWLQRQQKDVNEKNNCEQVLIQKSYTVEKWFDQAYVNFAPT